jgi:DNA-damage-inducible protein D
MQNNIIEIVQKTFEDIKIQDETWFEFWSARDLMKSLGYKKWQTFEKVIEKAENTCNNSWMESKNHFTDASKMVWLGSGSQRNIKDYLLTRYACYLIAQNWDSRKIEISLAQTYFASQTRKLELAEKEIKNNKRLEARKKLAKSERQIEDAIYNRWIKLPVEFATFKNKWIQALYWLSVKALKSRKWILNKRALADFDTEVELKAKDFIYAMTDYNIKDKNIKWKNNLENELIDNSKVTRNALIERDIIPEKLEKQEDLKLIEKKIQISKKSWINILNSLSDLDN